MNDILSYVFKIEYHSFLLFSILHSFNFKEKKVL